MSGVEVTGFVDKPIETILSEIEADELADIDPGFDVSAQSLAGQINGVMATKLRELWEVAQAVYSSIDPDAAINAALSALSSLTGTVKEAATKSTVTATVNLDAGKTLATGAVASVSGNPDARFVTLADATNSGGSPDDISVAMEAETAGVVVANSGTLTVIETAQTGWNTITNALDAVIGEVVETDADLRVRRETDLRRAGAGSVDAIDADIEDVSDVTSATVFENKTDVPDAAGVPAHAFEAVVLDGTANDIAQAIWDSKPAGIQDFGSASGTAVDADGNNQTVNFSRPIEVPIFIDVEVTVDADTYPATGDADIKTALAAFGQANLDVGDDVIYSQLFGIIFNISGVLDITLLETGIAAAPSGVVNIVIGVRSQATIDTGDITVVST